mmetsp:Transcript_125760/g.350397  ORF Transcript_125760/g.350397 Transcript_125760/m.350397 type:complete len:244 (-) Transcript_125760:527-1258(-)
MTGLRVRCLLRLFLGWAGAVPDSTGRRLWCQRKPRASAARRHRRRDGGGEGRRRRGLAQRLLLSAGVQARGHGGAVEARLPGICGGRRPRCGQEPQGLALQFLFFQLFAQPLQLGLHYVQLPALLLQVIDHAHGSTRLQCHQPPTLLPLLLPAGRVCRSQCERLCSLQCSQQMVLLVLLLLLRLSAAAAATERGDGAGNTVAGPRKRLCSRKHCRGLGHREGPRVRACIGGRCACAALGTCQK